MRRRDYISFFDSSRRGGDYSFARVRRGLSPRIMTVLLLIGIVGATAWWFAGRSEIDQGAASGRILGATTVPNVLLPESEEAASEEAAGVPEDVDCPDPIAQEAQGVRADWPMFQGDIDRAGCVERPIITTPEIRWTAEVGIQAWLNNPAIANGVVYVGGAGVAQFEPDRLDGVYAFDLASGERTWLFGTELDVNGVAYWDEVVVATGDEGKIWGIDAADGSGLWTEDAGASVFSNPLMVEGMAVVADANGAVTAFEAHTGTRQWQVELGDTVRGGASSDGRVIFSAAENGEVVAISLEGSVIWQTHIVDPDSDEEPVGIFAAPTVAGDKVIVSLVRDDVYPEPAIAALDKATGEVLWLATDRAGLKVEWGNVRSSPALAGDFLVYGEPYSSGLVAISLEDGVTRWSVEAGEFCFPAWSSPAISSGQAILPRFDGGIYGIDLAEHEVAWSLYLGDDEAEGVFPEDHVLGGAETEGEEAGFCDWQPTGGTSILASPALSDEGIVVVGSLEGILYAIGDEEWE